MKPFFVYILRNRKDNYFYTGIASAIEERLFRHNMGWVKPTKAHRPFDLIYLEKCSDSKEARKREKYFKSGVGRKYVKEVICRTKNVIDLPDGTARLRRVKQT